MAILAGGRSSDVVMQYLRDLKFPIHKDAIVHAARNAGAPNDIVASFENLPKTELASPEEVIELYPSLE